MVAGLHTKEEPGDPILRTTLAKTVGIIAAVFALSGVRAAAQPLAAGQGRIVSISGTLSLKRANVASRQLVLSDLVSVGDELTTDSRSEAIVQASDGSTVHIYPDSRVIFSEQSIGIGEFLHLVFGSIKVHIEKLGGRPNPHTMTTPTAVIAVRGTTFSVFVDDTDATLVAVDEGLVAVANRRAPSQELLLRPGQRTWVRGNQPPMRAQMFRGRSEQADMMPGMSGMGSMGAGAMGGAAMGAAASGHMPGTTGMPGSPGGVH